jgi:putative ATPase
MVIDMELLANISRPTKLSDIIGQDHLIGEGKILTNLVKSNKIYSMILYGKPGTGKTSIAYAMAAELNKPVKFLNATINTKADVDATIAEAKLKGELIVVMDEIHRLNKDKQDLLLPYIESGLIILIGLTTSNPYHSINPAIRSRCQIFELHELFSSDIILGLKRIAKNNHIKVSTEAYEYMAKVASGDFRAAINLLDVANAASSNNVTKTIVSNINAKPIFFADKNADGYYDVLSAFQKSIRGSDVDASLHYLARLIAAGDLDSIYRRMSVIAYEDIGLANPAIGPKVMAAISAAELVGLPEARIPLGTIVTEMALSPKSNSAHLALDNALNDINMGNTGNVPEHIKTTSPNYKYPHNYPNNYVKQDYLPTNLLGKKYYHPCHNKFEDSLNELHHKITKDNS